MNATATATAVISVMLVDDHDVVREGLRAILDREQDLRVVAQAPDAESALEVLDAVDPDVIVLDHRLPGMSGIQLLRELAERRVRARTVMLSAFLEEDTVHAAMLAGATAYVVKDVEAEELKGAIRAAALGRRSIDPKVAGRLAHWATRVDPAATASLTGRQLAVLQQAIEGTPTQEIARALRLSENTVKSYLRVAYRRLGVTTRTEAAAVVLRRGLL